MAYRTDAAGAGCTSLRDALRDATAAAHARLDECLAALDLTIPPDRKSFCTIQLRGFSRLGEACGWQAGEATPALTRVVQALERECGAGAPTVPLDEAMHPDAVAYVTLGSQLGTAAMRLSLPEDERTGLFGLAPDKAAWRDFRLRMDKKSPHGPEAERIIADAARAFAIFQAEAQDQLDTTTTGIS